MAPNGVLNKGFESDGVAKLDIVSKSGNAFGNAVTVRNAHKTYGKSNHVLKDLDMTVEQGTIYTLLGSSGCGKSTLLNCVVGLKSLSSGSIRVFDEIPGTPESQIPGKVVGFMPQEYALYNDFSVRESLSYYGLIYGMSRERVQERADFLLKFLDLPKPSRRVGTLSGGQKRRVSLAIALLHEPRLLILDEPTCGIDHLLRENIWNFLHSLVAKGNTTVIITTHYIEEARASDRVGFMRSGRLLTENSPAALFKQYNTNLLEDVVLSLIKGLAAPALDQDESQEDGATVEKIPVDSVHVVMRQIDVKGRNDDGGDLAQQVQNELNKSKKKEKTKPFSFSRFRALFNKNFQLLLRNYIFLIFNFITPALQIIVACLAIGNDPRNLNFGLINHEVPSGCVYGNYNSTPFPVNNFSSAGDCTPNQWSCKFLETFEKSDATNLISYPDEASALVDVASGKLWGYISFPANFSKQLFERQLASLNPENDTIAGSSISLKIDYSSQTVAALLQRILLETFHTFSGQILKECGFDERAADLPLTFEDPVFGQKDTNYREYLAPSMLLAIIFFLPLSASGISYISDRKAGTLDRSLVAGVTLFETMLANMVSQSMVLIVQASLSLVIMTTLFDIQVIGSFWAALSITVLIGVSGMSMGFLISSIVTEEIQAVICSIALFFPNFALAGIVWPVEGMPLVLQYLGYLLPCTLASESMRSIVTRGLGLLHAKVWPGFAATLGWIAIYWALTILFHRRVAKKG